MGTRDSGLKKGNFYYFQEPVSPHGPAWMKLEFNLRRIPHEFLKEKDGRIAAVFYQGEELEVEMLCERVERFA